MSPLRWPALAALAFGACLIGGLGYALAAGRPAGPVRAGPAAGAPRTGGTATTAVTVTNTSDTVDGDTTGLLALLGSPGPDGTISFREAIDAANGTPGPKRIGFAPALSGGRIVLAAKSDLLILASGDLTVDGDIDADGLPDVTLDGSALPLEPPVPGLIVDSSHNTISGMAMTEFSGGAVVMTCLRAGCAPKLFAGNRIISNTLSTSRGTAGLIGLSPIGLLPVEELPGASDVVWQDLTIAGNTLTTTGPGTLGALGINAGIGGASRNRVSGLTITGNRITGGWLGLVASGQSSDTFGVPGPPRYSDENVIEHVTIAENVINQGLNGAGGALYLNAAAGGGTRNVLSDIVVSRNRLLPEIWGGLDVIAADVNSGFLGAPGPIKYTDGNRIEDLLVQDNIVEARAGIGMNIATANFGNRDNELLRVQIVGNTVSHCQRAGINILGGNGGFGGPNYGDRSARDNRVVGLEVRDNVISDTWRALTLSGGLGGQNALTPSDANSIDGAIIAGNRIADFADAGIALTGGSASGSSASANSVDDAVITGNRIEQISRPHHGAGIMILGANGTGPAAAGNTVTGTMLSGNEIIRTGTGIQVLGGDGNAASGNTARVLCPAGNRMTDVSMAWDVRNDAGGAGGNEARVTWCTYLPYLERKPARK